MIISKFLKMNLLLWLCMVLFSHTHAQEPLPPIITINNITQMEQQQVMGQGVILGAVYSPNGDELAVQKATGIWIYDVHDMQAPPRFLGDYLGWGMIYHPHGQLLALVIGTGVMVVDVVTGAIHYIIEAGDNMNPLRNSLFSADGQYLIGSVAGVLYVWDAQTGEFILEVVGATESAHSAIVGIATHPKESLIAISIYDVGQKIRVWDVRTREWIYDLPVVNDIIYPQNIWHTPDGQLWVTTAAGRRSVWLWDVMTGELAQEIAFDDYIRHVSFHPTEPMMMVTLVDHVHIVNIHTGQIHNTFYFPTRFTEGIDCHYNPQGDSGLCLSSGVWQESRALNRILWLFDSHTGEIRTEFYAPYLVTVVYADATTLNAFAPELIRQVWDIATGEMVSYEHLETVPPLGSYYDWQYYAYPIRMVGEYERWQYIPEYGWLFGILGEQLHLHDSQTHALIQSFPIIGLSYLADIVVHPDGQSFAMGASLSRGERYDVVQIWDISGDLIHTIRFDESQYLSLQHIFYSADGHTLYAIIGRRIYTIDLATYAQNVLFTSDKDGVSVLAYLGDTALVFLGRATGEIDVVNLQTGTLVHTLYGHVDRVTGATLSADERWLVTTSLDGTIRLWGISD